MRLLFVSLTVLVAAAATAQSESEFGLFVDPSDPGSNSIYTETGTAVLLCWNPVNEHTGAPITTIGGFELSLPIWGDWVIESVTLPPNVLDFASQPGTFYCAGSIPVAHAGFGGQYAHLATVTFRSLNWYNIGYVTFAPYPINPSIPGHMAITDADDEYSITAAWSWTGSLGTPVFSLGTGPPFGTESRSWSSVKALYR